MGLNSVRAGTALAPEGAARSSRHDSGGGIALGLGCDRGTPLETLLAAIEQALQGIGASWQQVAGMASIDLKADEAAMQQLMQDRGMPVRFFSAEQLAGVEVPNPSEVVRKYTGTPSVSEAAALLLAGQLAAAGSPELARQRTMLSDVMPCARSGGAGTTTATEAGVSEGGREGALPMPPPASPSALLVEKHKLRGPDGRHATVSIARVCA
ncbi:MAG: cobalamin biosynthesis protein [Lautropia sp.]|nr:cobalamin biosynthesis protein [Lautropia sp.]